MILKTRDGQIEVRWMQARVLLNEHALSTDEAAALIAGLQENLLCARSYAVDKRELGSPKEDR